MIDDGPAFPTIGCWWSRGQRKYRRQGPGCPPACTDGPQPRGRNCIKPGGWFFRMARPPMLAYSRTATFNLYSSLLTVGEVKVTGTGMSSKMASLKQLSSTSREQSCSTAPKRITVRKALRAALLTKLIVWAPQQVRSHSLRKAGMYPIRANNSLNSSGR